MLARLLACLLACLLAWLLAFLLVCLLACLLYCLPAGLCWHACELFACLRANPPALLALGLPAGLGSQSTAKPLQNAQEHRWMRLHIKKHCKTRWNRTPAARERKSVRHPVEKILEKPTKTRKCRPGG